MLCSILAACRRREEIEAARTKDEDSLCAARRDLRVNKT